MLKVGYTKMRITKKQLRKLIREAIAPMTRSYVLNALNEPVSFGPNKGLPRTELVMQKVKALRFNEAASIVMDALEIDDPPMGADDELAKILSHQKNIDQIALAAADWGTKHFRMNEAVLREASPADMSMHDAAEHYENVAGNEARKVAAELLRDINQGVATAEAGDAPDELYISTGRESVLVKVIRRGMM